MTLDVMCSYCLRSRAEAGPLVASPIAAICQRCVERAAELFASAQTASNLDGPGSPWGSLTDDELLERLPEVASAGVQVEEHLKVWVSAARQRGFSWAKIGDALGMTRQSAWERFSD